MGIGEPKHAKRYCGKLAPDIDCFTNKHTKMYRLYGLENSGYGQLVNGSYLKAVARATLRGHRQGRATGNVAMLPGTFVVDVHGVIQFAHYSKHVGDHPKMADITAVGRRLQTESM